MTDRPVPANSGDDEPNPPMNRAERRAQRRGKQLSSPTLPWVFRTGRAAQPPRRRSGRRGNR